MKSIVYTFGLFVVSVCVAGIFYFIVALVGPHLAALIPTSLQKAFMFSLLGVAALAGLAYFAQGLLHVVRIGVPQYFSGWRYVVSSFGLLIFVATSALFVSLAFLATSGPSSGVPVALGLVLAGLPTVIAMSKPRIPLHQSANKSLNTDAPKNGAPVS